MTSTARGDGQQASRRQQRSGDQPVMPGHHHGSIVSHMDGRIRVRLHPKHRQDAVLDTVQQKLEGQRGVSAVTTNPRTGSVLVTYDHHRLSREDLLACMYDVGVIVREIGGAEDLPEDLDPTEGGTEVAPHSSTAVGLMDALTDLDRRLFELTGGKLDVKLLFPLGLGVLAARQIAVAGLGLEQVPGYVLLWYTFDSFYKLHQRRTTHVIEAAAEHITQAHPPSSAHAGDVDDEVMIVDEKPPG
jgi:hypothetical protein